MIAVDVNNVAELYDVGLRVLNEGLGPEAAQKFINLSYEGYDGDYTAEKKMAPDWTDAEYDEQMALVIENAKTRGEA
jgi:hypothetical protein